ncbi:MAG TPA: DUF1501 domain-containing protein [Tepidisphaeraceae bacterium]|nr:DUF1501 domain-containing protein [Tepidisphaeraceae bacterium]
MNLSSHVRPAPTRRDFLLQAGGGFGALALSYLLGRDSIASGATLVSPNVFPRAKSVIWLFMEGGPSHLDLFDPKPMLTKMSGQPMPRSFGRVITAMGTAGNTLLASKRTFKQHGQSGLWISDWHPEVAKHADDLCMIRSCWADGLNHVGSVCEMNTGSILAGRPSMGAWINYGLGSVNDNLPAFVVLTDAAEVNGGPTNWSAGFLPATYQGTHFRREGTPVFHLTPPKGVDDREQRGKLDLLHQLNAGFDAHHADDSNLTARINSYELAYRMQTAAPEAVDISRESEATKKLYGLDDRKTMITGSNCLLARRLVERGVRFVQVYSGSGSGWDAHGDVEDNHSKMCRSCDKPIAGLLADLKSRGLLDDTLVVWGGEFGRTPFNENGKGRDHNPWGFTMWMAGGGARGGTAVGSTDEIGLRAQDRPCHVSDVHATILYLMGLDHLKLTYLHNGRHERATVNSGEVIREVIA